MTRRIFFILIIAMIFGCSTEQNVLVTSETASHIQYFGFTLIDTYWDDPSDAEIKTNYADEVHSFSNIADILVVNPTDVIVSRMNIIKGFQMKSMLHLQELFFEIDGTNAPSGTNYSLRSDYQSRWNQFVIVNNLHTTKVDIQAFYIGEEPTWNGISFEELKLASDYIKSTIFEVPILLIEAAPAIAELQIPTSIDWIGFDHYFVKDPMNNSTYRNELDLLKSKFTTIDQKLVIVMDTHYISSIHLTIGGIQLEDMSTVAESYYELAKAEQKTIAILGYFWPSGFDTPEAIGARNLSVETQSEYKRIGREITKK